MERTFWSHILNMFLVKYLQKLGSFFCRESHAPRLVRLEMKVQRTERKNQGHILKKNLYFVLALTLHPSCCFHLGKKMFFLRQS